MQRDTMEKSIKPLRYCSAQRFLFIEAGLEKKSDRHLLCTWSTTALTATQTNTPKYMHIDTLSFAKIAFSFFYPTIFFLPLHHIHFNTHGPKNLPGQAPFNLARGWGRKKEKDKVGQTGVCICRGEQSLAYNLTSKTQSISVNTTLVQGGSCWQQINNIGIHFS